MPDERTYGFSKPDALEMVQLIGNADKEFPELRPRNKRSGCAHQITFTYSESQPSPVMVDEHYSGRDPSECGTVDVDYPLGEPCVDGAKVYAVLDTNTGRYKAISTESAMLGPPETKSVVLSPFNFSGCGIVYNSQDVKVFPCGSDPAVLATYPDLIPVSVISDAYLGPNGLEFLYNSVYVCQVGPGGTGAIATYPCPADPPPDCSGTSTWTWSYDETRWILTTPCNAGCVTTQPELPDLADQLDPDYDGTTNTEPCVDPEA